MVARIETGTSIGGVLSYNEKKVEQALGRLLYAGGFPMDKESLSFKSKQEVFARLTRQNIRTKTNAMHITLNFSPKDRLDSDKLVSIASDYMQGIGFGGQPFLVYQHMDAAHPHIHLATVTIAEGGRRLPTHNIGRVASSKVRREIEDTYGLIKVEDVQKQQASLPTQPAPVQLERVVYGKVGTRDAIFSIVGEVVKTYRFCSLSELNAVLNQFGVRADAGRPGTRMHANGGLVYALIDENYKRVGSAINASLVAGKPTLKHLRKRYAANELSRRPYGQRLRYLLDKAMALTGSQAEVARFLSGHGIRAVFSKDGAGKVFNVHFIDNATRVVYNGRDLGGKYSAQRFLEAFEQKPVVESSATGLSALGSAATAHAGEIPQDNAVENKVPLPAAALPSIEVLTDTLYDDQQQGQKNELTSVLKDDQQQQMRISR